MKNSIIQAYKEKNGFIGIVMVSRIEFIHQGTRGAKVLIDFKIDQKFYGSINSKLIETGVYYNYAMNGEPPFIVGVKYLIVFMNIVNSNTRVWPEPFQVLNSHNGQDFIEFCKNINKTRE